jgi:hypothetical protein
MKVLNLRCAQDHGFEGWFSSEDDFQAQNQRSAIECPLCGDSGITRLPSAPRLNLSGARAPAPAATPTDTDIDTAAGTGSAVAASDPALADIKAQWQRVVRQVLANTEDVGKRFPEEARRIHYGETGQRGIRGQASAQERAELADEGIEIMALPLPAGLKGSAH